MREAVWSFWEWYWSHIGLPLSLWESRFVESQSWSFVEILTWILVLAFLFTLVPKWFRKTHGLRLVSFIILIVLISGQGAFDKVYFVPSAWRFPVSEKLPKELIDTNVMRHWCDISQFQLESASTQEYESLSDQVIIDDANRLLDQEIQHLGYSPGRPVHQIKNMSGLTQLLGVSYGGPAYHDPLSTEIAIVNRDFYPTVRFWRIHAIFHEMAHAKGFTREIDAELLTWLALYHSERPTYKAISWLMFLDKAGQKDLRLPLAWMQERQIRRLQRADFYQNHLLYRWFQKAFDALGLTNSDAKYGASHNLAQIKNDHPFFGPVIGELSRGPFGTPTPAPAKIRSH